MLFGDYEGVERIEGYTKVDINPKGEPGMVTIKLPGMEQEIRGKNAIICLTGVEGQPEDGRHGVTIYGRMGVFDLFKALMAISMEMENGMKELAEISPVEAIAYEALRAIIESPGKAPK